MYNTPGIPGVYEDHPKGPLDPWALGPMGPLESWDLKMQSII